MKKKNEHQISVFNSVGVQSIDRNQSSSCLGRCPNRRETPGGRPKDTPERLYLADGLEPEEVAGERGGGLGITAGSKITEELFIGVKNDIQLSVDVTGVEKKTPST